jgi:tetratricopeptide (TPR) repeat protein
MMKAAEQTQNEMMEAVTGEDMALLLHELESPPESNDKLRRARQLFSLAQFEAALSLLASIGNDPEVNYLRCRCFHYLAGWLFESGDLERAESVSEQQLRECGPSFGALALRGEIASARNDDLSALAFFSRAITHSAQSTVVTSEESLQLNHILYLRVASLVRLQRYDEALDHWHAVIKRNENNSDLWFLGALSLVNKGRASEAGALCQRALALDPHHVDAAKLKARLSGG